MKSVDNIGSKRSGEAPRYFKYFDEIDEIFSDRPNVVPVALASSSRGSLSFCEFYDMKVD